MNYTDVQVGCLEVLRDYHKFELVCKHLFPYFTENCNFPSQLPSAEEEEFFTKMTLAPLAVAFLRCGFEAAETGPYSCE